MKIVQVNAVNGILSTGRNCSEMAAYLNARQIPCYTAYSTGKQTERAFRVSGAAECRLHGLLSRLLGLQGYFSPVATRRLLWRLDAIAPDVVHLHNLHANYISLGPLLAYLAEKDIPTVITLHDSWFYTGKCTHYTVANCYRWQTGCHDCPQLRQDHKSFFFDRTKKMWRDKKAAFEAIPRLGVIGVSNWNTREAERSFLACARVIRRVYNWVDLDVFRPGGGEAARAALGLSGQFVLLGVASRWTDKKGLAKLLALAQALGEGYAVVLVGDTPARDYPPNVLRPGATDSVQALAAYYAMADVFLQLSPEETFGKVAVEAMACGTPIISVDSTANAELVGPGCGYVTSGEMGDLLEKISAVRRRGRGDYEAACRSFVAEHFEKDACIRAHLQIYEEVRG